MPNLPAPRRRSALRTPALLLCLLLAAPESARGAKTFDAGPLEVMPAEGTSILNIAGSRVLPHLLPAYGIALRFESGVLGTAAGDHEAVTLVEGRLGLELLAAVGLLNLLEVGVALPAYPYQWGDDQGAVGRPGSTATGFSVGDLRLVPKLQLLGRSDGQTGLGIAFLAPLYLPTGGARGFVSDGAFRFEPRLAVDWHHRSGLAIALNAGYQVRPERTVGALVSDDELRWGVGLETPTGIEQLELRAALFGSVSIAAPSELPEGERAAPIEAVAALRYGIGRHVHVTAGGGVGLTDGIGVPDYRFLATLAYGDWLHDLDRDGLLDHEDCCPEAAEDHDGFHDEDGCPEADNDGDGRPDLVDRCPDRAEDLDDYDDADGCPDPDNDGDGLADAQDGCPNQAEDEDGFEDEDGCPDPDNDGDKIADGADGCANEAEDMDGFADDDGCPDPDNDEDGVPDAADRCPDSAETVNQREDEDGCPDGPGVLARLTRDHIELLEQIAFKANKGEVTHSSRPVVEQVAALLRDNPQITRVRIEVHTDSRGKARRNLELSKIRAESVRQMLIQAFVEARRLVAVGYGESRPVASNRTAEGRRANRRVELVLLEVAGKKIAPDDDDDGEADAEERED